MNYLEHLNVNRWEAIRFINGKGIEISLNKFTVFPQAIKIVTDDEPIVGNQPKFRIKDLSNPVEIEDGSLDYVFITMDVLPDLDLYRKKLKPTGNLIYHTLINNHYEFVIDRYTKPDLPKNNVLVIRYGAIGDLFQVASVCAALKRKGKYVIVHAQNPSAEVLKHDPNIDELISTDREIVRNSELRLYWDWLETQYEQVVNLCGSVEDAFLPSKDRPQFYWPAKIREQYLSKNYVEFQHELADTKYKLDVKFYPTKEEIEWAKTERHKFKEKKLICWALNGSSVHKVFPYFDEFVARVMLLLDNTAVITFGDERAQILEMGWQNEPRVYRRAGQWSIRQSLVFIQQNCDLLIGPETGLLNAMCCEKFPKIIFLSHSTKNNLTRDWVNTHSMVTSVIDRQVCDNCCRHRLHLWDDGFKYIMKDEETGVAHCQAKMNRDELWLYTAKMLK